MLTRTGSRKTTPQLGNSQTLIAYEQSHEEYNDGWVLQPTKGYSTGNPYSGLPDKL